MSKAFDVKVINAFLEGTTNVLQTMCMTSAIAGKPLLKKEKTLSGDVSGFIPLTGSAQKGVAVLTFSKPAILLIVSRMLSEEFKLINSEIKDAVGELTNMIAGDSRKRLEALGMKLEAGIPTVVIGKNHEVFTMVPDSTPTIAIPFKTDKGDVFMVEFTLQEK